MSGLANAVFGGQLLGHVIAGEELSSSQIVDSSINAQIAAPLVVDDNLSDVEHQIIEPKTAQHVIKPGDCSPSILHVGLTDSPLLDTLTSDLI
jgi:hypothetical protein